MPNWSNWSGKLKARPQSLYHLRSEEDAQAIVSMAANKKQCIRVAGATHSHAPLVVNDDLIIDPQALSGIVSTDKKAQTATVWAGTRIYALGKPLQDAGLALFNQGDIDQQAIAGATATGTHGTGTTLKNLSSTVIGTRFVLANGEIVNCSASNNADLWEASRLHLGAFGIVTQLTLQLRPAYRLKENASVAPLEKILGELDHNTLNNRHYEFFWHPQSDEASTKAINETDEPPQYPLAEEGSRCAWNHEVLPNYRPHKHTEMEYSLPSSEGPACMRAIQRLLTTKFRDVRWPVEYRTMAADDVWLSTGYQRQTVTISVHQDVRVDEEPYYRACEEIFLAFGGRPHWGKVHYLGEQQLNSCHDKWQHWWQARDLVDPEGIFLNKFLKGLRP